MAMSVRQLARQLGLDPKIVRGAVMALGVQLERIGSADRISGEDAERIRTALRPRDSVSAAAAS